MKVLALLLQGLEKNTKFCNLKQTKSIKHEKRYIKKIRCDLNSQFFHRTDFRQCKTCKNIQLQHGSSTRTGKSHLGVGR